MAPILSARMFLVSTALLAAGFAGCVDEGTKETQAPPPVAPTPPPWQVPAVPEIDAAKMLEGLTGFVKAHPIRAWNVETHIQARDALAKEFESAGLELWRQKFTTDIDQENICGIKLGTGQSDVWVVVGGHYDTTTWDAIALGAMAPGAQVSEGAYDDGSGTWLTVELAKAYSKLPTYYSIVFCAFDGEERGLEGSAAVHSAMDGEGEFPYPVTATRGMLDMDMFGICWPVRTPIHASVNNPQLWTQVDELRKAQGIPDDMFKKPGASIGGSDYQHWYQTDVPTVFYISDFDELGAPTPVPNPVPTPGVPGSYPWWHWVDTVETMTAMAGGPEMLQAGFQTALDLSSGTLSILAHRPDIVLVEEEKAANATLAA